MSQDKNIVNNPRENIEERLLSNDTIGKKFYQKIKKSASKKKWSKSVFKLLFRSDEDNDKDRHEMQLTERKYMMYSDKVIRKILVSRLSAFIADSSRSTTTMERIGNTLNFKTSENVIRKNITFTEKDKLNPGVIYDNERYLRNLPYIEDARILVHEVNGSDSVDVHIITKDVFSYAIELRVIDYFRTDMDIYNTNVLGLGHQYRLRLLFDSRNEDYLGYEHRYSVRNFAKTFAKANFVFLNSEKEDSYRLEFNRDFDIRNFRYAGGVNVKYTERKKGSVYTGKTTYNFEYHEYNHDLWLGRKFVFGDMYQKRLIATARLNNVQFDDVPEPAKDSSRYFTRSLMFLTEIGYSKETFFTSNFIHEYGKTEDIPYGFLYSMCFGYDKYATSKYYGGLKLSRRIMSIPLRGYFYQSAELSSFFDSKGLSRGVALLKLGVISRLMHMKDIAYRHFLNLSFTKGFKREAYEYLDIDNQYGIRGFFSEESRGNKKMVMSYENVLFLPRSLWGFRFTAFTFTDLAFVAPKGKDLFSHSPYSGFGLGIRFKNRNLALKAIQIRLAYYPQGFDGYNVIKPKSSTHFGLDHEDFTNNKPEILIYK